MKMNQSNFLGRAGLFEASGPCHEQARDHAEKLDHELGLRIPDIEQDLLQRARILGPTGDHRTWGQGIHQGHQTWVGLSHQTLQTPYSELKEICAQLNIRPDHVFVDLGAGYGRLGLVLAGLYPAAKFIGYELVSERVHEGRRILALHGCINAQLIEQDLTADDFLLPEADFYFLYDYGNLKNIRQTLEQLSRMAEKRKFKVIGRGKGTRSLIDYEHPWLSQVWEPLHKEHYSIYSMGPEI